MIQLYRPQMPGPASARLDFTLFVGPVTCFYHNCGGSVGDERQAALCPSDVQLALGTVEDAVLEALEEICADAKADPDAAPIESALLFTACQSAFAGLDFSRVARQAADGLGLLCLHHQNNRILMPAPGSRRDPRARSDGKDDFAELAAFIPQERVLEGRGLLVMNGSGRLHAECELHEAARAWGFDWVQSLGDWRSLSELERARSSAFVLVADERFAQLGERLAGEWGVEYAVVPRARSVQEVDACYDELSARFGAWPDLARFRESALAAGRYAAGACEGRRLELMADDVLVEYLRSWGIDAERADWFRPPRGPAPGPRGGAGGPGNDAAGPAGPRGPRPGGAVGLRSGDEHFPTSGPGIGTGPMRKPMHLLADASEYWGYHALYDCAMRLGEEVECS